MENENIIYIDYFENDSDVLDKNWSKFLYKIKYKLFNFLGVVKKNKNYFLLYCQKEDCINERMLHNLYEALIEQDIKNIICADLLLKNEKFVNYLESSGYKVLDGTWLFKFLAYEILDKISYVKNLKKDTLEVSFLTKKKSDYCVENIKLIAKNVKVLNVITGDAENYRELEKYLFDNYGIIINVSSNIFKSCLRSDVIFNFDFKNSELEKCNFKEESILVQSNGEKFERKKGIVINSVKLNLPNNYLKKYQKLKHFNETILYEGNLYYKNSFDSIRKILKKDNISIKYFMENSGKISFQELK